ncbi:hypothetical protein CYLTODRAFT_399105 [Cylindrobasidium torrendii FP15055 ss-10]|uniref:SH3 domain-containing protein n=1 Tax=Cylindrobasidium torrendii FP15055 ss-10 TaxID=1314674 RepID=A0A0D7B6M9_9AGAR|nr:hypothetical protein CYLTODRAFT_399105 [Cylindrobasidium torrendii FP15055 ss-10]
MSIDAHRPARADTYDLRNQIQTDGHDQILAHAEATGSYMDDEDERGVFEDEDEDEMHQELDDDDMSSDLSIPNESIDFDLVYAFHSFAATVEGQANVIKGDSLFLMDDSNSYWWLVRVLKTQEVGYIPAENIETPFERLARLNKHRNVDLAKPTELDEPQREISSRAMARLGIPQDEHHRADSPRRRKRPDASTTVVNPLISYQPYPPAVWAEEDFEEDDPDVWECTPYQRLDPNLMDDGISTDSGEHDANMEADDGMDWDDSAVEELRVQQAEQARRAAMLTAAQPASQVQQPRPRDELSSVPPASDATHTPDTSITVPRVAPREVSTPLEQRPVPAGVAPADVAMQQYRQEEERKRMREEEEEAARKRARAPEAATGPHVRPAQPTPTGGKLRKAPSESDDDGKGKKRGMLSSLFGRRKDKSKDAKSSGGSVDLSDSRTSSESSRSGGTIRPSADESPTATMGFQTPTDKGRLAIETKVSSSPAVLSSSPPQVSQLRQRDQQQQALYQQYLNRSPSSEAQPSYGLQSASTVQQDRGVHRSSSSVSSAQSTPAATPRPRPGSLVMSSSNSTSVPDLNVIRVFAGSGIQTDATFKTVLLNASTMSSDLVKQAMQRFRLPAGEDAADYYLTVKELEGSSARLRDDEKPLVVFETLVEAAMELPKLKRSSMGSISSISSNLSMLPAIKKLPMNDFTDDSAVKFYLNRHGAEQDEDDGIDPDETLIAADTSTDLDPSSPRGRPQYLTVSTAGTAVPAERFSSPSFRFALQLVIYPTDLPDDMAFDTHTEAIIFKNTLKDRQHTSLSSGLSMDYRRKVFVFPKNITVAEVIEHGLERFGILEGVVDGGDEVEDKGMKRQSSARVRYGLTVQVDGHDRELRPMGKVIESYPHPPSNKGGDRKMSQEMKRRSVDSTMLLGSIEDVDEDAPVFVLRRAVSYRNSSSRHRNSAPLDDLALRNLHRSSISSQSPESPASAPSQRTHRDIIEAQRQAKRENQRAILSSQANHVRGLDVLLPGNTLLRSSRNDTQSDRMRYSYVDTDGETYDISDIVEEEWKAGQDQSRNDLLESVVDGANRDGGVGLHRVLSKIRRGGNVGSESRASNRTPTPSFRSMSPASQYSIDDRVRATTPSSVNTATTRFATPHSFPSSRPGTVTPKMGYGRRQDSIQSVMSDSSGYMTANTPTPHVHSPTESVSSASMHRSTPTPTRATSAQSKAGLFLPKDDFGVASMLAIIERRAAKGQMPAQVTPRLDPVDEMLFGRAIDIHRLHPKVRDIYASSFKELDDLDRYLDEMLTRHGTTSLE